MPASSLSNKPQAKQHGFHPLVPYLLKLWCRKTKTSCRKTQQLDPQRVSGETSIEGYDIRTLREACLRLRSTFQQCEALCLQPSGPQWLGFNLNLLDLRAQSVKEMDMFSRLSDEIYYGRTGVFLWWGQCWILS